MPLTTHNITALTGGAARALDSYAIASLSNGDRAMGAVSGEFLYFNFNSSGTDAENVATHPYRVRPDDYGAGPGVWEEQVASDRAGLSANDFGDTTQQRMNLLDCGIITNAIGSIGGGAQEISMEDGNSVSATVDTSETTFTFADPTGSDELCIFGLYLTNGGSQTTNWPALGGEAMPTLTTSGVDYLVFFTINGTDWNLYSYLLDL